MRKLKLFKTLLVAAGLAVGASNAWAETVGESDFSTGYLAANSTVKTMISGTKLHYVFTQAKATDANYKGWLLWVGANGATVNWDNGISIVRGDNWDDKWPLGTNPETYGANTGCTSNFDWDNFNTDMNGATVDMTLTYTLGAFTMASTITNGEKSYSYSYAKTISDAPVSIDVCLSVNAACLDITTTEFVTPSITAIPCTYDFTAANALIAPFDNGSIRRGTKVQALTVTNQTATAWFDSNTETAGNQSYSIANNEKVTFTLNNYHGWLSGGKTTTVTIWAPEGKPLASYTYDANGTNITDVKIGGITPSGFTSFANNHLNGLEANGRSPFANDGKNPVITISVSGSKYVEMSFVRDGKTDASFSGTLGNDITAALEKITIVDGSNNADRAYHIGSLAITTETVADAIVTYVFEDTDGNSLASIKANQTAPGSVGEAIENVIPEAFKSTFYNGDESVKYVYSSFSCSDATVPAVGTTVTLKFNALTKFTYNIKAVDGNNNELATIASTSGFAGETKDLFWSKYIKVSDQWYVTNTSKFYKNNITEGGSENVEYSASDIAYFVECENMNAVRHDNRFVADGNESYSGYYRLRITNYYSTIYTDAFAEAGVYDVAIPWNNNNDTGHTYQLKTRDGSGNYSNAITEWTAPKGSGTFTYSGLVVPAGCSVAISCDGISGNSNARMDYLTLTPTKVSVPCTTTFATYANHDYALDFEGVSGLTAYTATVSGDVVTFTPAKQVPAGTGLLLKGATANVPVIATASSISDNVLYAPTANVTGLSYDQDGYNNYILSQPSGKQIGFYRANNNSVDAGKAYLRISKNLAREFTFIGLDNEASGIETISTTEQKNGEVYSLQGQRINAPQKGLYIVNGKKVIMK